MSEANEKQKRLVRLFATNDVDEVVARDELRRLKAERTSLESERERLTRTRRAGGYDEGRLLETCANVLTWLRANLEDRSLAFEALQLEVTADHETATVHGVLPIEALEFITDEQSYQCLFNGD